MSDSVSNSILDTIKDTCQLFSKYELTKGELARAQELVDKLENHKITVSVIGQFKRGKSTLVNAILGDKILPVGIVPVTAVVTTVEYGEKAAAVHFENGIIKTIQWYMDNRPWWENIINGEYKTYYERMYGNR